MKTSHIASCLAIAAGLWVFGGTAEAVVRVGWTAGQAVERADYRPDLRERLVYLGPEQRREMRQQMREQWQQMPPERREERRQEFRDQYRERWQQMPSDDRFRMREEMREHRGGRGRDFGGRR